MKLEYSTIEEELLDYKEEMRLKLGVQHASRLARPLAKIVSLEFTPETTLLYSKLSTIFATTYLCESTFSALKQIKSKYRSRLLDENVDALIRLAVADEEPDFKLLMKSQKEFHTSH